MTTADDIRHATELLRHDIPRRINKMWKTAEHPTLRMTPDESLARKRGMLEWTRSQGRTQ